MIRKNAFVLMIVVAGALLVPSLLHAEDGMEYEPISGQQLREILEDVRSWTAEAIELLKSASDLTPQEILGGVDTIRKRFDPVMVRMATTEAAGEYKQATIMLLMGAKGVELSLWHYVYAILADSQKVKDYGDALMGAAVSRLNDARTLFAQLP